MKVQQRPGAVEVTLDRQRTLYYGFEETVLLWKKYGTGCLAHLYERNGESYELKSLDALAFFLWVGLQPEARESNEEVTEEVVKSFINPLSYVDLFTAVLFAVARVPRPARALGRKRRPAVPVKTKTRVKAKTSGRRVRK